MKAKVVLILLSLALSVPALAKSNPAVNYEPDDDPKYGQDSIQCLTNLSLYREFFKQWKKSGYRSASVNDAIAPWRWVFLNCPKASLNTYVDGTKIVEYLLKQAQDDVTKAAYLDTLMMVYDTRIQYFGKEGFVLGRKGLDRYNNRLNNEDIRPAYDILQKSLELEGNDTEYAVVDLFFRLTIDMYKMDMIEKDLILENYEMASNIIDYNIKNNKKYASRYERVKGNLESSFEPFASCEDLIPLYTKKFEQEPENVELLKKIIGMLDNKGCDDSPLFFDVSVKLHDLEPSAESAFLIGKMLYNKQNYTEAIEYLTQGLEMEDPEKLETCYFALADSYKNTNDFPNAVKMAREVLTLNENDGRPYILIGDMYAEAGGKCGSNDLEKKAPYWAAVDQYVKAISVDAELADVANQRIAAYSKQFPTSEMIFFHDYSEGQSYTVECWFTVTTKIRAAK
jgi:tetratricopeptide (TPR) repeat protein